MNQKQRDILDDEIIGCHGESERRAAADFVLEAVDGDPDGPGCVDMCKSLIAATEELLRKLVNAEGE